MAARWSRGCGNGGIGTSGHKNACDYRLGVKIGNWLEDTVGMDYQTQVRHPLGFGEPFDGSSVARDAFTAHGKTGEALALSYRRDDLQKREQCVPRHLKLEHRDPCEPAQQHLATIQQISFGSTAAPTAAAVEAEAAYTKPRVQDFVWSGCNRHNLRVPDSHVSRAQLERRQQALATETQQDPYMSNSKATHLQAALAAVAAAASPSATGDVAGVASAINQGAGELLGAGGGCGSSSLSIGRKAAGPFKSECDKTYRSIGLRS